MNELAYKVLLIEDDRADAELIEIHLNKLNLDIELKIVSQKKQFEDYLDENTPHLILSDYHLPEFNGVEALEYIRKRNSDLPFILVSGYIGEEKAVDAMRHGATDYVLKDNLDRLELAVRRELIQYREKRDKEEALSRTKDRYELLINTIEGIVWESDAESFEFLYVSPQSKEILGYDPSEWYKSKTFWQNHIHPDDRKEAVNYCHIQTKAGENHTFEYRMRDSSGEYIWLRDYVTVIQEKGQPSKLRGIMVDITHQKETEFELDNAIQKLKERIKEQKCLYNISSLDQQELSIPEMLIRAAYFIPDGFQLPEITEACIKYGDDTFQTKHFKDSDQALEVFSEEIESGSLSVKVVYTEDKPAVDVSPFLDEEKKLLISVVENLALKINRKMVQNELVEKQDLLEKAYNLALIGNWELNVTTSEFSWSDQTKEIHEVPDDFEPTQEKMNELYKESKDWPTIQQSLEKLMDEGEAIDHEARIITGKGNEKWVRVLGQPEFKDGEIVRVFGSIQDIDKRKRAEEELQKSEQRLKALVQQGLDLIAIVDEEGKYKYIAPTSQRLEKMEMKPEEHIGKSAFSMFHKDDVRPLIKTLTELKPNESVDIGPVRYRRKEEGEWRWMESSITNLTQNPAIEGYVTNSRDVTNRIEQEKKLQNIVEYSTNLFYQYTADFELTYVSPTSKEFLGCGPEEAKERWDEFSTDHPVNDIAYQKSLKAIETGEAQEPFQMLLQKLNGEELWVEVNEAPIVEDGETVAIVGSLTDITEQKKYEDKLEELSQIAAKTTDIIFVADGSHRITWVNDAFEKSTGYSLEEALGKLPSKLFFKTDANKGVLQRIDEKMEKYETIKETIQIETKSGEKKWVDTTIDSIIDEDKESARFITIQKDVTEKIERENALQESLERYEIVTKATSDTIWDADLVNDTVTYNSNIHDIFGYDASEIRQVGDWWLSKIHPDDRERVDFVFKTAELIKKDRIQTEYRFQCSDGSYKYINDRAYVISDSEGNPVRMIGAMQDITKQKEENLWLKLLESAITNTTEAIAILEEGKGENPTRNILYANDAFEEMTGFSRDDVLEDSLLKFIGPNTDRRALVKGIQALNNGENLQMEVSYSTRNDENRWVHISFAPVKNKNEEFSHWICIGRDVTERRRRVGQLRESLQEKETLLMEIHHRVKNNLAVVSSMMQLQAMEEQTESLQKKLYDSVSRIRTMVTIHEMLYESGSFSKLDFSVNLQKLVSMITKTINNQKEIDVEFDCEEVELNVNQAIPSSLIVNEVVTNSIKHAFKNKKQGKIIIQLREENEQISLTVSDDGQGLPDSFDKLGTSSLGLQLIEVLSEQMDASYDFKSEKGKGTSFSIHFKRSMVKGIGNAYLV